MKFSLILTTLNRVEEVDCLLASLAAQTYRQFELIVVDRNGDDRLVPLLKSYRETFAILHVQSQQTPELARKAGLAYASGDVVTFADDSCTYSPTALAQVAKCLRRSTRWSGVRGRLIDRSGKTRGHGAAYAEPAQQSEMWQREMGCTTFWRRSVIQQSGDLNEAGFDEAGLAWALSRGVYYNPEVCVVCPSEGVVMPTPPRSIVPMNSVQRFFKPYAYALGRG